MSRPIKINVTYKPSQNIQSNKVNQTNQSNQSNNQTPEEDNISKINKYIDYQNITNIALSLMRQNKKLETAAPKLGDAIEQALTAIGITKDRVSKWLSKPCRCSERKEKLNRLSAWALRVIKGNINKANEYLNEILGD